MNVKDNSAIKREPNAIMFIKEEEFSDDYTLDNSLCVKEEVASICDDEQGYMLNSSFDNEEIKIEPGVFAVCGSEAVTFQEDNKFSLGLVNNEDIVQDGSQTCERNLQIKRKRRKQSESKATGKVKFAQKPNGGVMKSARISRDEIFKNKEYFCSLCQKCYQGRKCFKKHFKDHFASGQNRYSCLICTYTSRTVSHMNRHILETHFLQDFEDEKLFSCTLCEKRFHARKDLERHMFSHTGEGTVKCGECAFSCTRRYQLEAHVSSVHGYSRPPKTNVKSKKDNSLFICHYCNYSCKEKAPLRMHIKRHIGYKTFKCSECNYMCTAGGDLQKHCTTHSDDRPFVCNGCRKTFKRRSHLLIHFNGKYGCRGVKRKKNNSKNVKT